MREASVFPENNRELSTYGSCLWKSEILIVFNDTPLKLSNHVCFFINLLLSSLPSLPRFFWELALFTFKAHYWYYYLVYYYLRSHDLIMNVMDLFISMCNSEHFLLKYSFNFFLLLSNMKVILITDEYGCSKGSFY